MKENITMFKYTQMVVFFALSTAFYAVLLWIFAVLPLWIIPGITAFRPGNSVPPVTSLLWGPAATWGTAFGNLIGFDVLGGALGFGSIGGFIGNWVYGLLPYYTWSRMFKEEPHCKTTKSMLYFEATTFLTSSACAMVIGMWLETFNIVPFAIISLIITFNNFIAGAILGPILMIIFYDRVKRMGWLWTDIMTEYNYTAPTVTKRSYLGYILLWIGFVVGNFITIGVSAGVTSGIWTPLNAGFGGLPVLATGYTFLIIAVIGLIFMEMGTPAKAAVEEEE